MKRDDLKKELLQRISEVEVQLARARIVQALQDSSVTYPAEPEVYPLPPANQIAGAAPSELAAIVKAAQRRIKQTREDRCSFTLQDLAFLGEIGIKYEAEPMPDMRGMQNSGI